LRNENEIYFIFIHFNACIKQISIDIYLPMSHYRWENKTQAT